MILNIVRNANVSSVDFLRNTEIRPLAPWVEPLAALTPALIYFDADSKVSLVPEGSWRRDGEGCVAEFRILSRSLTIPDRGKMWEEGSSEFREGLRRDY